MKRDYMAICGILAVAFVFFFVISWLGDISIGKFKLRSSELAQSVLSPRLCSATDSVKDRDIHLSDTLPDTQPGRVFLDASGKSILIIGDSMLEGLYPRLAAYCGASGYKLYTVVWYSSTTEGFSNSRLLTDYIAKLNPGYIFISLGGNELFIKDVIAKRKPHVQNIIAEIGDIPYLWIGPPNWKSDTGINTLLSSILPHGAFFMSDGISLSRKKDGAHPTQTAAAEWMDSIVRWMPDSAAFVLPLSYPEHQAMRGERIYIHQPGEITHRP